MKVTKKFFSGERPPYLKENDIVLYPYERDKTDLEVNVGKLFFGEIWKNHKDLEPKYLTTYTPCLVRMSDELREELSQFYFPGGINVEFLQQMNGSWLVSFKANDIIASAHARLTNEKFMFMLKNMGY